MGKVFLWVFLGLIIDVCLASYFAVVARDKGYNPVGYWILCFLTGIFGYCIVNSLTDSGMIERIRAVEQRMSKLTDAVPVALGKKEGTWTCSKCQAENSDNYGQCKKCGEFRKQ